VTLFEAPLRFADWYPTTYLSLGDELRPFVRLAQFTWRETALARLVAGREGVENL
jgi:hypothetical protein